MKGNENLLARNSERLNIPHHNSQVSFKMYSSRFEIWDFYVRADTESIAAAMTFMG